MTESMNPASDQEPEEFGVRVKYQADEEKMRAAEFLVAGRAEHESLVRTVTEAQDVAGQPVGGDAVFDQVARTHLEAAAKLELLASLCKSSDDRIDLLARAEVERAMAGTAREHSDDVR